MSFNRADKFHGCLLGGLIGDCLGEIYEGMSWTVIPRERLKKNIGPDCEKIVRLFRSSQVLEYTG